MAETVQQGAWSAIAAVTESDAEIDQVFADTEVGGPLETDAETFAGRDR